MAYYIKWDRQLDLNERVFPLSCNSARVNIDGKS